MALDEDEVASILELGGALSRYFPAYESRPQQVEMLRTVTRALSEGQHLLVEAGTGTGKSFAYLIPAALWAVTNNERVVISTNTINLQEQLINKDIPDVSQILDVDLRASVLKGRSNYLCPRRLHSLRERGPQSAEEMRVLSKVLVWLNEGGKGDRNEINLNGPIERDVWSRLSAEDEGCKAEVCMQRTGGTCPFFVARQAAQSAHLIVINHALLLADIATGNNVLPNYDYLIVDEGHHLESATTNALSFRVSQGDLSRLSKEIGGTSSGLLSRLLTLAKVALRPSDFAALHLVIQRATDLNFRLDFDIRNFFTTIDNFLAEQRDGQAISPYGQQTRILPSTRTQNYWTDVEIGWDTARETLSLLMGLLKEVAEACREISTPEEDEIADLISALADLRLRLTEVDVNLSGLVSSPDPGKIYWAEISPNNNALALQVAPLHVGPLMEENLWHKKKSIIVTSATLTANNRFDYLRSRLNADEADELALGSPFDYENSALLYLANDVAEPSDQFNYQKAVEAKHCPAWQSYRRQDVGTFYILCSIKENIAELSLRRFLMQEFMSMNREKVLQPMPSWNPSGMRNGRFCWVPVPSGKGWIFPARHSRYWSSSNYLSTYLPTRLLPPVQKPSKIRSMNIVYRKPSCVSARDLVVSSGPNPIGGS